MNNGIKRKIRVYCPRDNVGFVADRNSDIFCRSGNHFLSSEFPPKKDFWGYCCSCRRFFPLSLFGEKNDSLKICVSCDREVSELHLCGFCNTILLAPKNLALSETGLVKTAGKVVLTCPSCEATAHENAELEQHECKVLEEYLWLPREKCPFCDLPPNNTANLNVHAEWSVPVAQVPQDISGAVVPEKVFEVRSDLNPPVWPPPQKTKISAPLKMGSKRGPAKAGCIILFIAISACALALVGKITFHYFEANVPAKDLSDGNSNRSPNLPGNSNTPPNPKSQDNSNSPSNNSPPVSSPKTKTFRNNSKITSDLASLRLEPNDLPRSSAF